METISYKCINCNAPLQYNPKKLKFDCEFCRSEFTEEELKQHFGALDEMLDQSPEPQQPQLVQNDPDFGFGYDDFSEQAGMYVCQSCGAEVIAEKTTAATFCVFCHSPVMLSDRLAGDFKPDKVIPFMISEEDAKQKFYDMCARKRFLPRNFVSDAQLDMMKGVYYPYWMVDSLKEGGIDATAKKVRSWREGDYEITETKIFKVRRYGKIKFNGYPCSAIKDEDKNAMRYVNPYDDKDFKKFTMSYLSGFLAEKRDVERADVQAQVDSELKDYARTIYKNSAEGYDSVTVDNMSLHTLNEAWQYALMPVWMMTFNFEGTNYLYAMNGQTGKTYGELPCDKKKVALTGVLLFIVLAIIIGLGGYFLL